MSIEGYIELFIRKYHHWSIPGIGTLHRVYRDAYLDHRIHKAHPGEESFSFIPENSSQDERWTKYLHSTGDPALIRSWDALHEKWLMDWQQGRPLVLPGVFEITSKGDKAEVKSLSKYGLGAWYGMPSVPFFTVNRELAIERMALPKPKLPAGVAPEPYSFSKEIFMPIMATLLVLVAYVMIFAWPGNIVYELPSRNTSAFEIDESRVNRSPAEILVDTALEEEVIEDSFYSDEERIDRARPAPYGEEGQFDEEMVLEEDTPIVEQVPEELYTHECIVIVGSFLKDKNVEKMVQKLEEMGYIAYQEPGPPGFTRVGARLECFDEEVLDTLSYFRKEWVKDAWVLKW